MIAFVIMYNRLSIPKQLCLDLERGGCTPVLIDNSSSYPPLLEWYKTCPYKVYRVPNKGAKTLWENKIIDTYQDRWFILTDPDLDISQVPSDFVSVLKKGLEESTAVKCGFSLQISDLPDNEYTKGVVKHEQLFWQRSTPLGYYIAPLDTTLALYDRERMKGINIPFTFKDDSDERFFSATRAPFPYSARHLPWYLSKDNIDEEEYYYIRHIGNDGYWTRKFIDGMVGIIIITYNIPSEVFILQMKAIQKYCKDIHTIQVFDNSSKEDMAEAIRYHASLLGISYTRLHSTCGEGSDSHSFAANTSYALLKDRYSHFFYLDHDCIPIKDFSVKEILGDKIMGGIAQKSPKYLWPGCFMFDNNAVNQSLINFSPDNGLRLDTGGSLYKLLQHHGEENVVFFGEPYHQNPYYNGAYNFYALIHDTFMHFIAASNWAKIEGNEERLAGLIQTVKDKTGL